MAARSAADLPPAVRMLEALRPGPDATLLLRALLCSGAAAREAWHGWRERVGNPLAALQDDPHETLRGLLALLHHAVARNALPVEAELATLLRTACFQEELRSERGIARAGNVLRALQDAGIDVLASGGWLLAPRIHPWPAARHSRALRLSVRSEQRARALDVATAHAGDLALVVGDAFLEAPFASPPLERVWQQSQEMTLSGVAVRVPSLADALLQVVARASVEGSRGNLLWAVDAWLLLARLEEKEALALRERVADSGAILPISALLHYVVRDLGAPAPAGLLEGLLARAADPLPRELEQGIACGRFSGLGFPALLRGADRPGLRARIVRYAAVRGVARLGRRLR